MNFALVKFTFQLGERCCPIWPTVLRYKHYRVLVPEAHVYILQTTSWTFAEAFTSLSHRDCLLLLCLYDCGIWSTPMKNIPAPRHLVTSVLLDSMSILLSDV